MIINDMGFEFDGPTLVLHAGNGRAAVVRAVESVGGSADSVRSVDELSAAAAAMRREPVTCLVCESALAEDSGIDLLAELPPDRSVPALFLTHDESEAARALEAGATDVFVRRDGVDQTALLARRLRNVMVSGGRTDGVSTEATVALLHSMYDVTTDRDSAYEEKVDRLLRLGCETFGLDNGVLTQIDEAAGTQTIVQAQSPAEGLQPGESCSLSRAYCRKTVRTDGLLAVANAVEDGWADDPAYQEFGLGCYIGGKVVVDGELYGTLCFSDDEARDRSFTELERTAVRLMSEWVSYELSQRAAARELELKNRAMDEAPVGILISDPGEPDNPAVYVNDEFTAMTGYEESAVLGRNCRFLQGEETREEQVAKLRDAIDAREPVSVELRNYREDGTPFWNRVTVAPIRDEDGAVTNFVGFQEDVTERKEHELDLRLRNRAITAAPVGVTLHDATERPWPVTFANDEFERITGYDTGEVAEGGLAVLTGEETTPDRIHSLEAAFEAGESVSETLLLYRRDGSPFWGRVSVAPVTDEDGAVSHAVGFLEDVTETKEHAETIERRLDEFGDVLAEELRTPLREARSRLPADPDTVTAADLDAAMAAIDRTDGLIDDLTAVHSFSVKSRDVFDAAEPEREADR